MNRQRNINIVLVILSLVLIFSCAKKEVILTQEQEAERAYYEAKYVHATAEMKFTQALLKYNLWCNNPEYKEACSKVDDLWLKANSALDTWGALVDSKSPSTGAADDYQSQLKALKTKLLMELPTYSW